MNRTTIDYADDSWNPVTGCLHGCPYCYARRNAERGRGPYGQFPKEKRFLPRLWLTRLPKPAQKRKPRRVLVCSMGDLFGDWVAVPTIWAVLKAMRAAPQHTFLLLTKNPKRYWEFDLPGNCWAGTSCENQAAANERIPRLLEVPAAVRWVSLEPLLGPVDLSNVHRGDDCMDVLTGCVEVPTEENGQYAYAGYPMPALNWIAIGAQTGPGAVRPDPAWVEAIICQARAAGVPVFCKDNLRMAGLPQEYPTGVSPP